jgi:hypothetical protein
MITPTGDCRPASLALCLEMRTGTAVLGALAT